MKTKIAPPDDTLAARLIAINKVVSGQWSVTGNKLLSTSHRPPATLIAVSKTHPASLIEEAIALGVTDFGENKVQEAAGKYPALKARHPTIRLHLIGPLQSNKAGDAVALFDVIHTIDRPKIADAIAAEIKKQGRGVQCLIQVNVGEEEQKAGVLPRELAGLLKHCNEIGLTINGLMCIPPANENPAPYFALMSQLKQTHHLAELSMGMSSDYQIALRFGATMVRVGTALFGERN